ncbi:MAG: DUF4255 domain-containing protein [Cyanobacteria bacterium J06597_1]
MSNHLAIATVTAVLQKKIQAAVQRDVDGARVTVSRPNAVESGVLEIGVNLYLYQVTPNHVWHTTAELHGRQRKGTMAKRSRTGLDLHYMLSFYGNEGEHEPQRLLGSTIRTLSDLSTLDTESIQDAISDSTFSYLADSDLAHQVEDIAISPLDLSLDDLSKVWSVFFQTPYALSVAYKASVAIVEGEDLVKRALPVRELPTYSAVPYRGQPEVDEVVAQAGRFSPILATSTLSIVGKQLKGPETVIRIGDLDAQPAEIQPGQLTVALSALDPSRLRAGVQTLTVIHRSSSPTGSTGTTAIARQLVQSNIMPFVLCPQITDLQLRDIDDVGDDERDAELAIHLDLPLAPDQTVVLALNEWSIQHPVAYQFEAQSRSTPSRTTTFSLRNVKAGSYLVRLQVDGASSPLSIDSNPDSPTYRWYTAPKLALD